MTEGTQEGNGSEGGTGKAPCCGDGGSNKKGMSPKDWATLTLSLLAFIVAALSAYWTVIRQVDDLRVMIVGHPDLKLDDKTINVQFNDVSLAFVNLGNRQSAVISISVTVDDRIESEGKPDCSKESDDYTKLDFRPTVIEAGKIQVKKALLGKGFSPRRTASNLGSEQILATVCLGFEIVMPGSKEVYRRKDVGTQYVLTKLVNQVQLQALDPQIVLYQRWGTIFSSENE